MMRLIRVGKNKNKLMLQMLPIMDVMFLLLCALALMIVPSKKWLKIPVDLATSSHPSLEKLVTPAQIGISAEGQYSIDSIAISDKALNAHLARLAKNKSKSFGIAADGNAPHKRVMKVLDLAKQNGISDTYFIVEKE